MSFSSIGDLAQNLLLRRQSAALQRSLSTLTSELVTGQRSDVGAAVRGDFGALATIERSLSMFDGFAAARGEVDLVLSASQTSLEGLQSIISGLGQDLLASASLSQLSNVDAHIDRAADQFEGAISLMNTRVGDRYVFSGQNASTPPIASIDAMMSELRLVTAAAMTVADFNQAIDDWFDLPAGGFETLGYFGGDKRTGAVRVGPSQVVRTDLTAEDEGFKETLRNLGKLALLSEGKFSDNRDARFEIAETAALGLIEADIRITRDRAAMGVSQGLLSAAESQVETERQALALARTALAEKDPFETASELEAIQTQIETLYTVTARNSRLNLMEYLR